MTPPINLLSFNRTAMADFFAAIGEKPFRANQVIKWLHQFGRDDFEGMSNLSKALRRQLAEIAVIRPPRVVAEQSSADGTRKWVLQIDDNNCVETVFIPEEDRGTLCVSSQVGCPLDCSFCATAKQGFNRNLNVAEIIGQVWVASERLGQFGHPGNRAITNVVMMGMGEPLLNFNNVVHAMELMMDDFAYNLSRRRVTLSTAGLVPAIDRLGQTCPVSLAVSLHAPNDELRDQLVPLNRKYPIADLLAACRRFIGQDHSRRITFEYVMLDGINDSPACARELVKCLRGIPAKINLIPFNKFPGTIYNSSSADSIDRFRDILIGAGLMTITRKTRGEDIDAACGQLVGKVASRAARYRAGTKQYA